MQIARNANPNEDALIRGHLILALGLLNDQRTLQLASDSSGPVASAIDPQEVLKSRFDKSIYFVTPKEVSKISEMDAVMGARAALLGLAVLGDARARPILLANWGREPWTSLEAARAMGWCGVYDAVDPTIALMRQEDQKNVAAWSARSLGEMLDADRPSKLCRLVEKNCFAQTVQGSGNWIKLQKDGDEIENEFHGLGNPFLYSHILPRVAGKYTPPWVR